MAQQLKNRIELHDREIMETKQIALASTVKDTAKQKKTAIRKRKSKDEDINTDLPINKYLEQRSLKIKKNKAKLASLGLGSPRSRKSPRQVSPKRSPKSRQSKNKNSKSSAKKGTPKTKRKIFSADDEDTDSEDSCTYNHKEYHTGYKREDDKRYWKEGAELFGTKCMDCMKTISEKETCNCIVPSLTNPIHICLGRNKYNCHHCYCNSCYRIKENIVTQNTRRSSRLR